MVFYYNLLTVTEEAKNTSSVKIVGNDVVATWKIIVASVLVPAFDLIYTVLFSFLLYFYFGLDAGKVAQLGTLFFFFGYPCLSLGTIIGSERGIDILKSLRPLILCLLPGSDTQKLVHIRDDLQKMLIDVVDEYGKAFPVF